MITVETIRDLNNRYGAKQPRALVCESHGDFTADLARYWVARDREYFLCPECDRELWLQFRPSQSDRLAQRHPVVASHH